MLAVVAFHAFPRALPGGFVGVDIFFVISGFLITGLILAGLREGTFSFADFYARRVRRIFPALFLVLAGSMAIGWVALVASEYRMLSKHAVAGAGFFANYAFLSEAGYFDVSAELKPLLHLWSLSVEEQFYILWPLLLVVFLRRGLNALTLIVLLFGLSFLLNIGTVNNKPSVAFFSLHTRLWELGLGCLLAYQQARGLSLDGVLRRVIFDSTRQSTIRLEDVKAVTGAALIAIAFAFIDAQRKFPGFWAALPTVGAYLVISAGPHAIVNRILGRPALVFVGLISYPLYLWHWPLLSFLRITESGEPPVWWKAAAIAASLLLAWLTYVLVEKPIRRSRRIAVPAGLVAALVVVAGVGVTVYRHDGLQERVGDYASIDKAFAWPLELSITHECKSEWLRFANVSYCLRTHAGKAPTVALLGDSHANMYFIGLSKHYEAQGENLLNTGKGGCAPFYGLEGQTKDLRNQCELVMNDVLDFVIRRDTIHTVILTSKNPYYVLPDAQPFMNRYVVAMRDTLTRLRAAGKKVTFIVDAPALEFNPKSCVQLRPLRLSGAENVRTPCAIPRAQAERQVAAYRQAVKGVLADFPAVAIYDPMNELCDTEYCWGMRDGKMIYRDDDHLSVFGSSFIGGRFSDAADRRLISTR